MLERKLFIYKEKTRQRGRKKMEQRGRKRRKKQPPVSLDEVVLVVYEPGDHASL